ncbi:MAG: threonine ammonia-lyase [Saccharolobus sp.]
MKYTEYASKIRDARERILPYIHETPIDFSTTFSRLVNAKVYLKLENLQKTGSFKVRGAFNKLLTLRDEEKKKGVIAVSAGNHAQGVAYASSTLNIKSIIVMPETAPISKYLATRSYGSEVVLYGKYLHESMKKAEELISNTGMVFIHPYDDIDIIAGQGTIGFELYDIQPDMVIVPIGGGGLISGVSIALKYRFPSVKIIGVQSSASPSMKVSKDLGRLVQIEPTYSIADGILVKSPSELTFNIVNELVDDIVLVDDDEIAEAIVLLLERSKTLVEGAAAATLAALISGKIKINGLDKKVISLLSGGNIDLSLLATITERSLYRQRRVVKVRVIVPDKPGQLNKVLSYVVKIRGNIIDIIHDRHSSDVMPGYTKIYITFELQSAESLSLLLGNLINEGIDVKIVE